MSKAEPIDQRVRYFTPYLNDSDMPEDVVQLFEPTEENPANVVSSLDKYGRHRPALDIDVPHVLLPSSTEGHGHLYFPSICLNWPEYARLLKALGDVGILGENYVRHSLRREQTILRLPHVKKERKGVQI